jgi:hypothetical protein
MKETRLIAAVATTVLFAFGGGCVDGGAVLEPGAPAASIHSAPPKALASAGNPRILASGTFVSQFDLVTLSPQGNHCIVQISGDLILSGTLQGTASGSATARIFAPCAELTLESLDDFRSVFRFDGYFVGTVDGEPAQAELVYQGRSEEGGGIDGKIRLSRGLQGVLHVDGQALAGGTYEGFVIRR